MAPDRRSSGSRGGFTLLELVVALSILALIAGSVTLGLRLASSSIERGEETAREAARLRAAVEILERSIRSADPMPVSVGDGESLFFSGEGKRLRFLTAQPPAGICGGGSRLVSFHEVEGVEGGLAISTASPFRPEGAAEWEGTEDPRLLVRGAAGISFTYSPGADEDGKWEWLGEWNPPEEARLPAAVRVEFTIPSEEGPRKTAFVVPVMAGGGAGG